MGRKLVTCFSAEGNTKEVAKRLAGAIGADFFEIVPEKPYTKADINWMNPLARCNREQRGKKDVPVAGKIEGFEQYDMVFIGFPIWYWEAPLIIKTFAAGYDWSGKKIALFATSGGSGMGKTAEKLAPSLNGKGEIVDAKLFSASADEAVLREWADSLSGRE